MRGAFVPTLVLLAACAPDPDEILHYSGTVLTADQLAPLTAQEVVLSRSPNPACDQVLPYKTMTSDADGGWSTTLYRGELEVQGQTRSGRCLEFAATFPSGARTQLLSTRIFSTTRVPDLFEWSTSLAFADGGLRYTPLETPEKTAELDLQSALGPGVTHEATVTAQGETLLTTSDVLGGLSFDGGPGFQRAPIELPDWMLEDFDTTLSVVAKEVRPIDSSTASLADDNGEPVVVQHTPATPTLAVRGSRVPVSRGAPCPPLGDPCPLTDGELAEVPLTSSTLELQLSQPAVVSRVVVRGALSAPGVLGGLTVELRDGAGTLLGSPLAVPETASLSRITLPDTLSRAQKAPDQPVGAVEVPLSSWTLPDAGTAATNVRLRFFGLSQAREVSLFEEP